MDHYFKPVTDPYPVDDVDRNKVCDKLDYPNRHKTFNVRFDRLTDAAANGLFWLWLDEDVLFRRNLGAIDVRLYDESGLWRDYRHPFL